jgi:hypothetical protein
MASLQVSGNVELLEIILLNLPLRDMLLAQSVCWTWRNVISTSPGIQQALFFRPARDAVRFKHNWSNILDCTSKDQCERLYQDLAMLDEEANAWVWSGTEEPYRGRIIINPFFDQTFNPSSYRLPGTLPIPTQYMDSDYSTLQASWKRMLLMQPPVVEMVVDHGHANHWHALKAKDKNLGLTGTDFADSIRSFVSESSLGVLEGKCFRMTNVEYLKSASGRQMLHMFKFAGIHDVPVSSIEISQSQ